MNTKEKELTEKEAEQIVEWEAQALGDAIGNCLELNEEFLERYCSKELAEWRELNYFDSGRDINLPVGEVEWQDEEGNLQYVECLGIAFKVDIESLKEDWKEWNSES